jgi:hypothetical protein
MGMGRGRGRGFGRGFGRGGWWRFGREPYPDPYYRPEPIYHPDYGPRYKEPDPEEEKAYLEVLVKDLEDELKAVKDRLKELIKEKPEK